MDSIDEDVAKVQVKFKTDLVKYKVTEKPFSVPINLNRRGLSQVINHLLGLSTYLFTTLRCGGIHTELRISNISAFVTNSR